MYRKIHGQRRISTSIPLPSDGLMSTNGTRSRHIQKTLGDAGVSSKCVTINKEDLFAGMRLEALRLGE